MLRANRTEREIIAVVRGMTGEPVAPNAVTALLRRCTGWLRDWSALVRNT